MNIVEPIVIESFYNAKAELCDRYRLSVCR